MLFADTFEDVPFADRTPLERVLAIEELWANVIAFLYPRQLHRLRLVSRLMHVACLPHMRMTLSLSSCTPSNIATDPAFPAEFVTALRLEALDQVSPMLLNILQECPRISSLEIKNFGLDVTFIEDILRLCSRSLDLRCLLVRSDGFVTLDSMVGVLLCSAVAGHIQTLQLDVGATGLDEAQSLPWASFRSILDSCSSLTRLSLGGVTIMDVPESLEQTNALHAITAQFPNIVALTLNQCDITGIGRVRLLRMFPNLKSLEIVCRDTVFAASSSNDSSAEGYGAGTNTGPPTPIVRTNQAGVEDRQLCANLKKVNMRCTNTRSHADQEGLCQFLCHLSNLQTLELSGFGISVERLAQMAEEWTRRGAQLKHLRLDLPHRKVTEAGLEKVLRQGCCSRLESLDLYCGSDLVLNFWNQETLRSQLPCLETLRALHLRRGTEVGDLHRHALQALNLSLRQMPRLVDLTIATKLDDFAVFQGMGRDPDVPLPASGTTGSALDWAQERPFLQSLVIGLNSAFFLTGEIPRQITRRFRFLEDVRWIA